MRFFKILAIALVVSGIQIRSAQAADLIIKDAGSTSRPMQVDVVASVSWWDVGMGGWFAYPILPEGFIKPLNDSFCIEGGIVATYFYGWGYYNFFAITPLAGVRWNFFLTEDWTVFATAKVGARIGFERHTSNFWGGGSVGGYWNFSDSMALRLEVGAPFGLQAGLSFNL